MSAWTVPGYTEQREIGRGPSGLVVQALDDASGQPVAIKYLSPALVRDPAFMRRFRAAARALEELRVPQVVRVYDYGERPGEGAMVVTELVNGVSLHELIERRGPAAPEAALAVLKDSLLGLAAVHRLGIAHPGHQPVNVLVDTAGTSKLTDVGVAERAGDRVPGAPHYLAPERWHGASASPLTDVYAATGLFFECLTGEPPFSGSLGQLCQRHESAPPPIDRVDPPLRRLAAWGMAKDPSRRPHSATAFVAELAALAGAAYGPGWEERGRRELAERVSALLPLLLRGARAGSPRRPPPGPVAGGGGGGKWS
jgi:serine/threonine-protein kinase